MELKEQDIFTRIGTEIRRCREAKGLSLSDIEAATGLDQSNISKYEKGKKKLGVYTLYRIAEALETTIADLTKALYR
ncbi:helix-turn-helix domain-containing protein [Chitinophaga eiseniae]|uniref:helix-turn-helix domain-containing protein n=1 Tax=Chitinophaga eiseniae TaxID=634771 RepID=UPI0009998AA0